MSQLEEDLALQMRAAKLPAYVRELRFAPPRRWRFDFAWPEMMIAVEVEGVTRFGKNANGTMRLGRHQTAAGYEKDCEKYNTAALEGWKVLRCTGTMVKDGRALEWIDQAINGGQGR